MKSATIYCSFFAAALALLAGCAKSPEENELKRSSDRLEIVLEGMIEPSREAKVMSTLSEKVTALYVKNGAKVAVGQLLGTFDEFELKQAYRRAVIERDKARLSTRYYTTTHSVNKESLANAKERMVNTYRLYKTNNASLYELKNAEDAYYNLLNNERNVHYGGAKEQQEAIKSRKVAEKDVERASLEVERARNNYAQIRIVSPIAGYLTDLKVSPGQTVSQGETMAKVIDIEKVNLKGSFSPGIYGYLKKDMAVEVSCFTTPPYKAKGIIREISPVIDSESKRMRLDIPLENRQYLLQPGDKCVISIDMTKKQAAAAGIHTDDSKYLMKSDTK